MIIPATIAEYGEIYRMLQQFAGESPTPSVANQLGNDHHVFRTLNQIQRGGGVVMVSTDDDNITGMLIALRHPDIWLPDLYRLTELAWWVKPQYRGGTAGYRLLRKYTEIGDRMLNDGTVSEVVLTTLATSPDMNLFKRGWIATETNYRRAR